MFLTEGTILLVLHTHVLQNYVRRKNSAGHGHSRASSLGVVSHKYTVFHFDISRGLQHQCPTLLLGLVVFKYQLGQDDVVQINKIGDPTDNYPNFEEGQEFFEGRDYNHNLVYENLNYEQFKHDDRDIWYYINAEGELCVRVNEDHTYDDGASSSGEITY